MRTKHSEGPLSVGLKAEWTEEGLILHSELPAGMAIGQGEFGRCLIATRSWEVGDVVYRGEGLLFDADESGAFKVHVFGGKDSPGPADDLSDSLSNSSSASSDSWFTCDIVNSVKHSPNPESRTRQFYGFDGFMNHACKPNLWCPNSVAPTTERLRYDAFAVAPIQVGDELTCDYALFDYECDGHAIEKCGCGGPDCRGSMRGFKSLDFAAQVGLLHRVDDDVRASFFAGHPEVKVVKSPSSSYIGGLLVDSKANKLVAAPFKAGAEVFTNATLAPTNAKNGRYLVHTGGRYFLSCDYELLGDEP